MNKLSRRQFLQFSGVAAGALLAEYGCTSKPISPTPTPTPAPTQTTAPTATSASSPILEDSMPVSAKYLGQTPPGDTPVIFAPSIISQAHPLLGNIAFSPDGKECYFGSGDGIYYIQWANNTWMRPVEAPFSRGQNAGSPFFSADGNRLYFCYTSADYTSSKIWFVERTTGGWGEPQLLPSPINSDSVNTWYTETTDGVVYLSSNRAGGVGDNDIWCIRHLPDQSLQAENLGPMINSTAAEYSPCIAPDGSYLVFSSYRSGGVGFSDLYIVFRKDNNEWSEPINMERSGAGINLAKYDQVCPSLSTDGKFMFFFRHDSQVLHCYWISTHIFVGLKETAFAAQ